MDTDEYDRMYALESSHWWYRSLHELIEAYVRRIAGDGRSDLCLLDAGCGTGMLLTILGRYGRAEGIDYSDRAVDFCRQRGLERVQVGDVCSYEYVAEKYDLISCIDVLYHEWVSDDTDVLRRLRRALKPGGTLVLNLAALRCLARDHDKVVRGVRRYNKSRVALQLKEVGFSADVLSYRLSFLVGPVLLKKCLERIRGQKERGSDLKSTRSWLNWLLVRVCRLEGLVARVAPLPFGTSLFVVARKI